MTHPGAAHAAWWRSFEVVFGAPALVAIALQILVPWSFPDGVLFVRASIGIALIFGRATLVRRARRALRAHRQPTDPGRPTTELISTGVFAYSRNPLYLGGIAVVVGLASVLDLPWMVVLVVPSIVVCHYLLIVPEERYLAERFGDAYRSYAASVGRWWGRAG